MSATERKVVHEHLKDREDVETYSEGADPTATSSWPRSTERRFPAIFAVPRTS